jgi:hypothetical protein
VNFLRLSEVEQYNTVWSEGVHVETHINYNIAINLYYLINTLLWVYYDIEDK